MKLSENELSDKLTRSIMTESRNYQLDDVSLDTIITAVERAVEKLRAKRDAVDARRAVTK